MPPAGLKPVSKDAQTGAGSLRSEPLQIYFNFRAGQIFTHGLLLASPYKRDTIPAIVITVFESGHTGF